MSEQLESRVSALEATLALREPVERVQASLLENGVFTSRILFTPEDYYQWSLEERAKFLGGNVSQLCKTIVFENVAATHEDTEDVTNSRYYCVITPYIGKINTTALRNFIHSLRPPATRLSKNSFNLQLAPEAVSAALTGFTHNGVCPIGLAATITAADGSTKTIPNRLPVLICSRAVDGATNGMFYLGAGRVDAKLLVSVKELLTATKAVVGMITDARDDL